MFYRPKLTLIISVLGDSQKGRQRYWHRN